MDFISIISVPCGWNTWESVKAPHYNIQVLPYSLGVIKLYKFHEIIGSHSIQTKALTFPNYIPEIL